MGGKGLMNPFQIFIAFVSWGTDGKNRPVLVLSLNSNSVSVYPITTQYETKSEAVKARYFKINDLVDAGLTKQSYIDTGTIVKLPYSSLSNKKPIGSLTTLDKQRLLDFLGK